MQNLNDLINKVPNEKHEDWFTAIAQLLMSNYIIEAGTSQYKMLEMEFYYHDENHQDETTYGFIKEGTKDNPRIIRQKKGQHNQLTWFFHYSGVDIVFGKEDQPGGILIRSIQNIETGEIVKGPLVVLLELLNQRIKVDGSNALHLKLVETNSPFDCTLQATKRVGIGAGNLSDKHYNFSVK